MQNNNDGATFDDAGLELDERRQELERWMEAAQGIVAPGVAASSDASFRRYFRYQHGGQSLIAMDAPPATEDCRPFVQVASLLAAAGVNVPQIIAQDLERGFLLLSDIGTDTFLDRMSAEDFQPDQADPLFDDAIAALLQFQQDSKPGVLPEYDEALLLRELQLFPEWYLQRHLGLSLDGELKALLDTLFAQLIEQVLSQAKVWVHRDYMPRNLMISTPSPGVLDFQDAVYGPISYDPICLFKDAFISWPEDRVQHWLSLYWARARDRALPVPEQFSQFQRDCDFMGVQRHLKVIGIFARICHRDGKSRYLEDVPRFFAYLETVAARQPDLAALAQLLKYLNESKTQ